MSMIITSPAFEYGKPIPVKYTCDGVDISPELRWNHIPPGTESLVLIMDDPDAPVGVFTHWVVFNLPPESRGIPEGANLSVIFADASLVPVEGRNDFGRIGYGGPCPPPGPPHRYFFRLYAVEGVLNLPRGARKEAVLSRIRGYILSEATYMGIYQRGGW